jgi:hypothetical protein
MPGLLQMLAHGALGDGALLAVVTVPDPADLRDLVRAGRAFTSRSAVARDRARQR